MNSEHLTFIKDILIISGYFVAVAGGVFSFYKWILPKISPYIFNYFYLHSTGVHVIRDIEAKFGKEAGRVIRQMIRDKGIEIVVDEMRLNIIENAIGLGIYICSPDGKCTYANKTLAKMFGLSQTEMLGNGWLKSIVNKQLAYSNWQKATEHNIPYDDVYEVQVDSKIKKYHTQAEPSMDEDGVVILGYVGIVREVKS